MTDFDNQTTVLERMSIQLIWEEKTQTHFIYG